MNGHVLQALAYRRIALFKMLEDQTISVTEWCFRDDHFEFLINRELRSSVEIEF